MTEGQGAADIEAPQEFGEGLPRGPVQSREEIPADALLEVDLAERSAQVGVREPGIERSDGVRFAGHVLEAGQGVELAEEVGVHVEGQVAWVVPQKRLLVPEPDRVALAARLRGTGEIVEICAIPFEPASPVVTLELETQVEPFVRRQAGSRGVGRGQHGAIEGDRIGEVEGVASRGEVAIPLDHRIGGFEPHTPDGIVGVLASLDGFERPRGHGSNVPVLELRMLLDQLLPEEGDGVDVLERLRLDASGHEAFPGVPEHDHRIAADGNGPEETRLGVAHGVDLAGREFEPEDVRCPRVVRTAIQIPVVLGEDEVRGNGGSEVVLYLGCVVALEERLGGEDLKGVLTRHLADRSRDPRSIGRHIEVVHHRAVGPRFHLGPLRPRGGDADDGADAVVMPYAPQGTIRLVEREVADARVLEQHARALRRGIEGHDVSKRVVVGGVEDGFRLRVEGQGGDGVEHRALDVLEPLHRTVVQGDGPDVADHPRVIEGAVDPPGVWIEPGPGHGPEGALRQIGVRGDRVAPDVPQVPGLEAPFEGDPVLPGLID